MVPSLAKEWPPSCWRNHPPLSGPMLLAGDKDPLPQTPYVVFDLPLVHRQPVSDIALRSVRHSHAVVFNMPISSGVVNHRHSSQAHLTTSAPFQVRATVRIWPVIRNDQRRARPQTFRFPVAYRPPSIRFLVIPLPLANWASLTVGLPATNSRTPTGLSRFARVRYDRRGRPLYPWDGGAQTTGKW